MGFIYDWTTHRRGIMVTSFIFQGGSGFALTIYYQPTVMVLFLVLHLSGVYLTGIMRGIEFQSNTRPI